MEFLAVKMWHSSGHQMNEHSSGLEIMGFWSSKTTIIWPGRPNLVQDRHWGQTNLCHHSFHITPIIANNSRNLNPGRNTDIRLDYNFIHSHTDDKPRCISRSVLHEILYIPSLWLRPCQHAVHGVQ